MSQTLKIMHVNCDQQVIVKFIFNKIYQYCSKDRPVDSDQLVDDLCTIVSIPSRGHGK